MAALGAAPHRRDSRCRIRRRSSSSRASHGRSICVASRSRSRGARRLPNLVYSTHVYPWSRTGLVRLRPFEAEWTRAFGWLADTHPVFAGEWGGMAHGPRGGHLAWGRRLESYLRAREIGWAAWSWADWPHLVTDCRASDYGPTAFGALVKDGAQPRQCAALTSPSSASTSSPSRGDSPKRWLDRAPPAWMARAERLRADPLHHPEPRRRPEDERAHGDVEHGDDREHHPEEGLSAEQTAREGHRDRGHEVRDRGAGRAERGLPPQRLGGEREPQARVAGGRRA